MIDELEKLLLRWEQAIDDAVKTHRYDSEQMIHYRRQFDMLLQDAYAKQTSDTVDPELLDQIEVHHLNDKSSFELKSAINQFESDISRITGELHSLRSIFSGLGKEFERREVRVRSLLLAELNNLSDQADQEEGIEVETLLRIADLVYALGNEALCVDILRLARKFVDTREDWNKRLQNFCETSDTDLDELFQNIATSK